MRSAGAKPRPFTVTTCTTTLRLSSRATARAFSTAFMSCPSTGPMYLSPNDSKKALPSQIDFKVLSSLWYAPRRNVRRSLWPILSAAAFTRL